MNVDRGRGDCPGKLSGGLRLRCYRGQRVEHRPPIPADDRVSKIPGLQVNTDELNLYSEVEPLRENIPPLRPPGCVARCPAGAIPEEPLWWRGVYKRKVNDLECWRYFSRFKGCAVCINSCPFHRFGYPEVMEHFAKTGEVLGRDELLAEEVRFGGGRASEASLRKKTSNLFLRCGDAGDGP